MSTDFTDRPQPFPEYPRRQSNNTVLIILAVVGGAMLLCGGCVVVCITAIATLGSNANGTFSYVATKVSSSGSTAGPEAVAELFFQEINALKLEPAYGRTSTGFQRRYTLAAFGNLVAEYPTLTLGQARDVQSKSVGATSATLNYRFTGGPAPALTVDLKLIPEGGAWKIDQMTVKPAATP